MILRDQVIFFCLIFNCESSKLSNNKFDRYYFSFKNMSISSRGFYGFNDQIIFFEFFL